MKRASVTSQFIGVVLLGAAACASAYAAEETSQYRTIERIQYSAASKTIYFVAKPTGWGAPSCPNATYAQAAESETPGVNTLTSLVMQAKASGTTVAFIGTCAGADYFKVNYVIAK